MHNMHYETKSTQVKAYCIILGHDYLSTIGLNIPTHGHSFSKLTSFAHSKGVEDVLASITSTNRLFN